MDEGNRWVFWIDFDEWILNIKMKEIYIIREVEWRIRFEKLRKDIREIYEWRFMRMGWIIAIVLVLIRLFIINLSYILRLYLQLK